LAEENPPAALLFRVDEVIELVRRCPLLSNVRFTPERANASNATLDYFADDAARLQPEAQ